MNACFNHISDGAYAMNACSNHISEGAHAMKACSIAQSLSHLRRSIRNEGVLYSIGVITPQRMHMQ